MSATTTELKNEIKKSVALVGTLRDEIRLKVHLAGMDAKDQWQKLEPMVESELEHAGNDITEATRGALSDVVKRLEKLRDSLI